MREHYGICILLLLTSSHKALSGYGGIGRSKGCQGSTLGSKFFHFHAVFGKKICKIIGQHTHSGSWPRPQENPGFSTGWGSISDNLLCLTDDLGPYLQMTDVGAGFDSTVHVICTSEFKLAVWLRSQKIFGESTKLHIKQVNPLKCACASERGSASSMDNLYPENLS